MKLISAWKYFKRIFFMEKSETLLDLKNISNHLVIMAIDLFKMLKVLSQSSIVSTN